MLAAVCTAYGGPEVVKVREARDPVPARGEVLVRIRATTVASGDARVRAARFPPGFSIPARLALGITRPRQQILGTELAGVIEGVGAGVTRYRPGDAVFAMVGAGFACHAELRTLPESGALAAMPTGLSFEEAAALSFGGTTALYFLRDVARTQPGERVLVNGASGTVGLAAVQIARHLGAHVTGVCSAANTALVRSLGADEVIDYKATDFATTGQRWDVVFDAVGNASLARSKPALRPQGRLLMVVCGLHDLVLAPLRTRSSGIQVSGGSAPERPEDLACLKDLWEAKAFKAVIDSRFPLAQIAQAHARVDTNRKVGSVVVTCQAA